MNFMNFNFKNNKIKLVAILFIICFINEKLSFINHKNFKNIVKNIILILPFLTLYLGQNDVIKILNKKKSSRKLSETKKKIIASNQNWRCNHCKNVLNFTYEIDHIIPLYKGGNNELYNLQALCRNCHGIKTYTEKLK